jgi:hypothetical protein
VAVIEITDVRDPCHPVLASQALIENDAEKLAHGMRIVIY